MATSIVHHATEMEALRDFPGLLARAKAGEEIVIDTEPNPITVHFAQGPGITASEALARAELRERTDGPSPVTDPDFADDLEFVVALRDTRPSRSYWDE